MEEIIKFLQDSRVFSLATIDGDQARVRPMGFVMNYQGKLTLCTSNKKPMYQQMKANPKIEISATSADMQTLRVYGKVSVVTSKESQEKALEAAPQLKGMYAVGDGLFELFAFESGSIAVFSDMAGGNREVKL
jgi:uncharacterized pyridoxamine 5'-phosphate oxidase family protein